MRTPVINKGKAPLPGQSGANRRNPTLPDDGKNDDIFQSHHNQLPRDVSKPWRSILLGRKLTGSYF